MSRPFLVLYANGSRARFATFEGAAVFYWRVDGYALINTDRQTDGGNYAGLTDEQRGELGL